MISIVLFLSQISPLTKYEKIWFQQLFFMVFVQSGINQLILDKFWDNVSEINLDDKNKKY